MVLTMESPLSIEARNDERFHHHLRGFPAGVKFNPTDQGLLEHLKEKVKGDASELHPLLHEFIPLIQGNEGICYTHPVKLPD
ncbi:hypothetical protein EJ110_NYTH19655 [Nymphaea thermarum]|nr:hypothetical protein EJ110_NYTH19655 [Nymphaea thermarum]